ncbi:MAG: hypothetical protein IKR21_05665, partial [Oscillospiraceae bacterium]|nr:hypothetical protein [Oscillospiraceae bacterium]
ASGSGYFFGVDSKGAVVNGPPVALQSRDPARPPAGESTLLHQSEKPVDEYRRDFCFVFFILQFSVFIIHLPDRIF